MQNDRGTTTIEFAVIAPLFFLVVFAILEFGLIGFTQIALQSAVANVSRSVSLNNSPTPGARLTKFNTDIRNMTSTLPNGSNISVASAVVGDRGSGGVATKPDICLTQPASSPAVCPLGTPYQDINGNNVYDGPGGQNLGASGNLVQIQVTLPWEIKFPFLKSLFSGKDSSGNPTSVLLLSASTIIKNE